MTANPNPAWEPPPKPHVLLRYLFGAGDTPSLLLLALVTACSLLLIGYEFATADQLLYLAFIPRYFDPSIFNPNDVYASMFLYRTYTTLFLLLGPLVHLFGWEWPLFVIYVLVKFFFFWGVWAVTFRLTRDHRAAGFAVVLVLLNVVIRDQSEQIYSGNLICRYLVYPILLFGLKRFWEERYLACAILFGIAFQFHALSTVYWVLIVILGFLVNFRRILFEEPDANPPAQRKLKTGIIRRLTIAIAVFSAFALPMLIWKWLTTSPMPEGFTHAEWVELSRFKHSYIFASLWNQDRWLDLTLCWILFAFALLQLKRDRTVRWFAPVGFGAVLVFAAYYLATDVLLFQPLYQFQWIRVKDILIVFAMIGAARIVSAKGDGPQRWLAALAGAMLLAAITFPTQHLLWFGIAIAFLGVMSCENRRRIASLILGIPLTLFMASQIPPLPAYLKKWIHQPLLTPQTAIFQALAFVLFAAIFYSACVRYRWFRKGIQVVSLMLLVLLVFTSAAPPRRAGQRLHRAFQEQIAHRQKRVTWPGRGMANDWVRLQTWARDNTPKPALFFTPIGPNGFRVFSQRSAFAEIYDGEVSIFDPSYAKEWRTRMKMFGFWPPLWPQLEKAQKTYQAITAEQWIELSRKYGADYLITDHKAKLPFPELHKVGPYTVWRIEEKKASPRPVPQPPASPPPTVTPTLPAPAPTAAPVPAIPPAPATTPPAADSPPPTPIPPTPAPTPAPAPPATPPPAPPPTTSTNSAPATTQGYATELLVVF